MAIVIEQSIVSDATKEHVSLKLVCGSVCPERAGLVLTIKHLTFARRVGRFCRAGSPPCLMN